MDATTISMLDNLMMSVRALGDDAMRFNDLCQQVVTLPVSTADSKVNEALEAENERLKKEIGRLTAAVAEKESTVSAARNEIAMKQCEIDSLRQSFAEKEASLATENEMLRMSVGNASATSCRELKEIYVAAARRLADAASVQFLEECREGETADVIDSMHSRIRNGVAALCDALSAVDEKNLTVAMVNDRFKSVLSSYITEKPIADIARWYAYSRLPFMLDTDREEGRRVIAPVISKLYNALSTLLALGGLCYQLPALFVENIYDGDYEIVTGSEQMTLDYQCPNVMSHTGSIDRADRDKMILDIVEVGYYDNGQLVKKTKVIA